MGLEADVVLLLDVDGSRWSLEPRNLYVAASRARLRLHVFVKEGMAVPRGGATDRTCKHSLQVPAGSTSPSP
jgi:hypothetical protein